MSWCRMRRLFCCGIVGAVRCLIVVGFALLVRELRKGSAMFGALSDVASEVDALRAEIGGLAVVVGSRSR